MSVINGYLTTRLFEIWNLRREGFPQIDIASKLGISRQAVNQALLEATEKVAKALTEAALINKIEVESVNPIDGILSGWSREFSVKAVITLTRKDGMQVWYEHAADCAHCDKFLACQAYLFRSAVERGIKLTKEQRKLPPSRLAQILFGLTSNE
jgi:transcriptional regulator